jgi:hypothetical protein
LVAIPAAYRGFHLDRQAHVADGALAPQQARALNYYTHVIFSFVESALLAPSAIRAQWENPGTKTC